MSNQLDQFECTNCKKSFPVTDKDSHDLKCLYSLQIKDSEITDIPCDTCGKMIPFDGYMMHQNTCGMDPSFINDIYRNMRMGSQFMPTPARKKPRKTPPVKTEVDVDHQIDEPEEPNEPKIEEIPSEINGSNLYQITNLSANIHSWLGQVGELLTPKPTLEPSQIEMDEESDSDNDDGEPPSEPISDHKEETLNEKIDSLERKIKDADDKIKGLRNIVDEAYERPRTPDGEPPLRRDSYISAQMTDDSEFGSPSPGLDASESGNVYTTFTVPLPNTILTPVTPTTNPEEAEELEQEIDPEENDYAKLPNTVSSSHYGIMTNIIRAQASNIRRDVFGFGSYNRRPIRTGTTGHGYSISSVQIPAHIRNILNIAAVPITPYSGRRNAFSAGSGETYEELIALGERIGKVELGVTNIDLVAPKIKPDDNFISDGACAICHDKYDEDVDYRETICGHNTVYCNGCISTWLDKNRECPFCMKNLEDTYNEQNRKTIDEIDLEKEEISDDVIIDAMMSS